ncbi:MAG TPA: LysM peptidoglycan-binding domain-containing protein [Candidatus Saccharimonadales bacterium]
MSDFCCRLNTEEICISNSHLQSVTSHLPLEAVQSTETYRKLDQKVHKTLRRKSFRRQAIRYGLVGLNVVLLLGVISFVVAGHQANADSTNTLRSSALAASSPKSVANPLDQVSSADIAFNVASMSAMSEVTAVANQAASVNIELTIAPATASIVSKPQVVSTALKSKKDIKTYVAVAGDNVAIIAAKFNVTSDSIKWSNNLSGSVVTVGQTLSIPPEGVSGIVYTVKAGDTPESLATKYKASKDEITAFNDVELTPLKVGERIIIPGGSIAAPVIAPVRTAASNAGGFAFGTAPIYGNNAYAYGYCTWYVAGRVAVPSNWGNANTWDNGAAISGWTVSSVPRVGAIGQTNRGAEGHVAIVTDVSADGTMIKYSDMNGLSGWGRVGSTPDFVSAAKFENYIYQ